METKKKIIIALSVCIGAAFLYFGFSGMLQKKAEEEKNYTIENTIVKKNMSSDSSNGLDNLAQ